MNQKYLKLKKEDLLLLKRYALDVYHVESIIYQYDDILLKIFLNYELRDKYILRKILKIDYYLENKSIDFITNPIFPVYIDGLFAGYGMDKFNAKSNFYEYCLHLNKTDSIRYLKTLINMVKELHQKYIAVVDLNYKNILVNDNSCKLCDVDSYSIHGIPADNCLDITENNKLLNYRSKTSYLSDIYVLYLIILNILYDYDLRKVSKYNIIEYQESIKELKLPNNIKILYIELYDMINNGKSVIYPDQFIDELDDLHLKKEPVLKK